MAKIDKRYEVPASPASVFDAWISSDCVVAPVTSVAVDPRVGGCFILRMGEGVDAPRMTGRIVAIEQHRALRYIWCWNDGDESLVDVRFLTSADGTQIRLTHDGLASAQAVVQHSAGWDAYVVGLREFLLRSPAA